MSPWHGDVGESMATQNGDSLLTLWISFQYSSLCNKKMSATSNYGHYGRNRLEHLWLATTWFYRFPQNCSVKLFVLTKKSEVGHLFKRKPNSLISFLYSEIKGIKILKQTSTYDVRLSVIDHHRMYPSKTRRRCGSFNPFIWSIRQFH